MPDVAARSTHSLSLPGLIVLIIAPEYLTWALSLIV